MLVSTGEPTKDMYEQWSCSLGRFRLQSAQAWRCDGCLCLANSWNTLSDLILAICTMWFFGEQRRSNPAIRGYRRRSSRRGRPLPHVLNTLTYMVSFFLNLSTRRSIATLTSVGERTGHRRAEDQNCCILAVQLGQVVRMSRCQVSAVAYFLASLTLCVSATLLWSNDCFSRESL